MHMVDSKYSLKLKNNHKPENKCIDAKKCQFLFVMQYWRMNCGTLSPHKPNDTAAATIFKWTEKFGQLI